MSSAPFALLLLSPFAALFAYAGWHEYARIRREGRGTYGLAYDPETDSTHVTLLGEDETGYDPATEQADSETETEAGVSDRRNDESQERPDMTDTNNRIAETVQSNDVVLFMKGTKTMPQCGFSSRVAGVLNYMGVEFTDVNVLADEALRQGIKDFSDWPTIPQLYVKGEFVGGCDIITEMTLSGELDQLFEAKGVGYDKAAAEKIREANA